MTVYTVHLQGEDAQDAAFVPEGFSWGAFLVPPIWLLWHRLWLAALLWCAIAGLLILAPLHVSSASGELVLFLMSLLCGLEGQQWRRQKLTRRGKPIAAIVTGGSRDEAEIHFFHRWAEAGVALPVALAGGSRATAASASEPAFGLFPEPENRS